MFVCSGAVPSILEAGGESGLRVAAPSSAPSIAAGGEYSKCKVLLTHLSRDLEQVRPVAPIPRCAVGLKAMAGDAALTQLRLG
jgi:hypothetical protein